MGRPRASGLALALLGGAGALGAQDSPERLARDPDRGLDAALRERLALVDPAKDTWPVERWAALVDARLRILARLFEQDRIVQDLAREDWIAPDLAVPPLHAGSGVKGMERGPWSIVAEGKLASDAPPVPLARALSEWRADFRGPARLDLEVVAIDGDAPDIRSRVRLTASGAIAGARVQHDAVWTCTWHVVEGASDAGGSSVRLVGLRPETFASVRLAGERPLFEDVTESAFGTELFRAEIAPGLQQWKRSLPSALEPGILGHHGIALGDADGDGLEDLYWCRPGGLPNRLFLHASDDGVRDVSAAAGVDLLDYSSCALLSDLDADTDADLLVATGTGLVFFANDGHARFEQALHVKRSLATSLAAADYDADGDLDVYACSYVSPYEESGTPVPYIDAENGEANQLFRNDGKLAFTDATAAVGLDENNLRFSLAAAWEDFDDDGDPDLCVANDFGLKNLYRNDGGRFHDVAAELGALDVSAGMGVTWGDADEDGRMDVYFTNLYSAAGCRLTARADFRPGSDEATRRSFRAHVHGNTLLLGGPGGAFRDATESSGTARGRWGWGAIFLDLDLDGALDLFAPNGLVTGERSEDLDSYFWREVVLRSPDHAGDSVESYELGWRAVNRLVRQGWSWNGRERNVAFLNLGHGSFADVSSASGLDFDDDARSAAYVDWDGDGDEDLIVANRTSPMLRILRNETRSANRWIAFELRSGARTPVGARVELVTTSGRRLLRTLGCGEGYLAQSSARLAFGLGIDGVSRVAVRWPGADPEEFGSPSPGALHVLERGKGKAVALPAREPSSRLRAGSPVAVTTSGASRTVLPVPLPLPRLALTTADGRAASLLGITMQGTRGTGQPLLLVVWSSASGGSRRALERLAAASEQLAGVQVLALSPAEGEDHEQALAKLTEIAWPFARGFASEEALQTLELVEGALHDDARGLVLPTAFLVDPSGRLQATYEGELDPGRVHTDLALFELASEARRDACVPFPGRWIEPPPEPFDERVAARLDAHGLERPAAEYRLAHVEVRELSAAKQAYDQAVAAHRGGRLAESVALYRKALELDGSFARAAQDLAVALHQQGDRVAARKAYEHALELEPGHALTRCNLGVLCVEVGDIAAAKTQLEALRTLKSDLADALEERIREAEKR